MKPPWPWILAGIRRHLVVALLLLSALVQILGYLMTGDATVAQVPPEDYLVHKNRIRMAWFRGDDAGSLVLQLVTKGGDFDNPAIEQPVRGSYTILDKLKPDKQYRWRLKDTTTGEHSNERTFRTAEHLVRF